MSCLKRYAAQHHTLILEFHSSLQPCFYPFESACNSCHRLIKIQIVGVPLPKCPASCQSKWEIARTNPTQINWKQPCKMHLLSEPNLFKKPEKAFASYLEPLPKNLIFNTLSIVCSFCIAKHLNERGEQFTEQSPECVVLQTYITFFYCSPFTEIACWTEHIQQEMLRVCPPWWLSRHVFNPHWWWGHLVRVGRTATDFWMATLHMHNNQTLWLCEEKVDLLEALSYKSLKVTKHLRIIFGSVSPWVRNARMLRQNTQKISLIYSCTLP